MRVDGSEIAWREEPRDWNPPAFDVQGHTVPNPPIRMPRSAVSTTPSPLTPPVEETDHPLQSLVSINEVEPTEFFSRPATTAQHHQTTQRGQRRAARSGRDHEGATPDQIVVDAESQD